MLKPVTLVCGHSGCQSCFARLIKEPIPKCPLCKKVHPRATALNVNIILNDIIDKLEIQCTNNGCQWQGTLENHTQHSNTCGKLPLSCPNRGCSEVKPRDEMTLHVSQCAKQDVACQECGKRVTRDSMREHINSLCSHKRIPCPLSCGTNLPRCYVTLHLSECPEKAVKCAVKGCNGIIKRKKYAGTSLDRRIDPCCPSGGRNAKTTGSDAFQENKANLDSSGR